MTADQIKAIEEFAGCVMRYYTKVGGDVPSTMVVYYIDLLVKEYKNQGE
jgi:hypothetical protein